MPTFTSKESLRQVIESYFDGSDSTDISNLDTSQITDMSYLFKHIQKISDNPITLNWDTSNVANMAKMFFDCEQDFILNFQRQAVGNECLTALCDTRRVTNMSGMFYQATNFNQPLNFDTSNVTDMTLMFYNATTFNQPLNFDTRNVTDMSYMFLFALNFNQQLNFNTSNVKRMCDMFRNAINFNQPLNFDTSNIINMIGMFRDATNFNQPIYFPCQPHEKGDYRSDYRSIFNYSLLHGQENKFVLQTSYYYKLLLLYVFNKINPVLLILLDEFEEFYYCKEI